MKKQKFIPVVISFLLCAAILPLTIKSIKPYLEERLPDEFTLEKIALDIDDDFLPAMNFGDEPDSPSFSVRYMQTPSSSLALPNFSEIGEQPFHYIGHGGQSVAFASEDDRYVLKFFLKKSIHGKKKYPIPKPTHWIAAHRKKRQEAREQKALDSLMRTMTNYATAFEKIKEKTGLIALHLTATENTLPTVTLLDQYEQEYFVDLDRASFVLQHKAQLVGEKLASLKTKKEKKQALLSLKRFFEERAKAGFIDNENSFMITSNYGFLGDEPIQLDLGSIKYSEELESSPKTEISRLQNLLRHWVEQESLPPI